MTSRWVMLDGTCPGVGKSTLAENLAEALTGHDTQVDLIAPEGVIFERPEFDAAARGFRTNDYDLARTGLLGAYRTLVDAHADDRATVIFDWSAASMAEDLPWAVELDALISHMREVTEIVAGFEPVLFMLESSIEIALDRAIAERGHEWLEREVAHAVVDAREGEAVRDRVLRGYRAVHPPRLDRVRRATEAVGWSVESISATRDPRHVASEVLRLFGPSR